MDPNCFRCHWKGAPRYHLLSLGTDLRLLKEDFPDMVSSKLSKKCEALAVSGLEEYGDDIDLIAPVDILKQVFKTPFSRARVSIAVHRVGKTIVLNPGPDEEEEELIRRENLDKSLFLKFDMHSVRMEARECECLVGENRGAEHSGDSGEHERSGSSEFLRVLPWNFHNIRMLLGSDMLLFRNEKHVPVSLHLWDVNQEVTFLNRFEIWLDNVVASVPELAICHHRNGIVQLYDVMKTNNIILGKAMCKDTVEQKALNTLNFLDSNCKDGGSYWVYKSYGDDKIQFFSLMNNEKELDLRSKVDTSDLEEESLVDDNFPEDYIYIETQSSGTLVQKQAAVFRISETLKSLILGNGIPTSKLDKKLWILVLLLGESYLSLGEAYKEDGQLQQALHAVELACSTYGSMPQKFEETVFISSMNKGLSTLDAKSGTCLFWSKVWMLVGDVYVEFHNRKGQKLSRNAGGKSTTYQLRIPYEVVKLVERLKRSQSKNVVKGGILKYLKGSSTDDPERNLLVALKCYEESLKALQELGIEYKSIIRKKGWVCNELGRNRLRRNELEKAEDAFGDAIMAFKELGDHTNVILINCNLGHGRRSLAEDMVQKLQSLKLKIAYQQAMVAAAKLEYSKSLRYYKVAKAELDVANGDASSVPDNLKVEVHTQLANTFLRFGMLLANEDTARGQEIVLENTRDVSDAMREAVALYESLGEIRKQEAAYAYLELARYHRDCCLRLLETEEQGNSPKAETNVIKRAKQYALLADMNWQKSVDVYSPENYPTMFVTVLIERSALSFSLSNFWQSNTMLDTALSRLLEGRHVSETFAESLRTDDSELYLKFWTQLQKVLKRFLALSLQVEGANKGKLRELYKTSLKSTSWSDLESMHALWTSSS